jgi:hypothetical protein
MKSERKAYFFGDEGRPQITPGRNKAWKAPGTRKRVEKLLQDYVNGTVFKSTTGAITLSAKG